MKRHALQSLETWKNSDTRKPMLIRGARQVGKTWLMKEFGRTSFQQVAYINFDRNERICRLFNGDLDISRLITGLEIEVGFKIDPKKTLLVFDEVQECPRALNSLKYFCEDAPEYAIVAAGSLLGVAMHQGTGFPVGKVDFLDLYPMSFTEFLEATGNARLAELLDGNDWELITAFKEKFIEQLRFYFYIGGMPEAVASFANKKDFNEVRNIQRRLLDAYEEDFSKHAPKDNTVPRLRMMWTSIPVQLAKENRKFFYGMLRDGARSKDYELALQWLLDCGLVYRVSYVSKPDIPLAAYSEKAFKLFMLDVGLLSAKSDLDLKSLLEGNRIFEEFKGALTEQYVQQQLRSECGISPCYWAAEGASAEVDFLFQHGMEVYPLEVKASENSKAKSLVVYSQKYHPKRLIRTTMSDYRKQENGLLNLPLYAVSCLLREL